MINSILTYRKHDDSDSGFTLIELLIVIVVLAILAGITIFALGGVTGQSAKAACQSDAKTVETALQAYDTQNSTTLETSSTVTESAVQTDLTTTGNAQKSAYLHTWPTANSSHYTISVDSTGNVFVTPAVSGSTGVDFDSETQSGVNGATASTGCFNVS